MGILNAEVEDIDIVPVAKGIASRWWIVLIAAVFGVGAMWSQESNLSTTPSSTKVVRVYESRDELALLSLVGVDPAAVSPFPSFDNQILQVKESPIRDEIVAKLGFDLDISITRSEQRFSLLDTVEGDGKTKFTFLSVGTPSYTFSCIDASPNKCNAAIDEYLARLSDLRKNSVLSGLNRLETMLEALQMKSAESAEKIEAINAVKALINGELAPLSTTNLAIGGTVSTVKSSTYIFGLFAGAFVGLIIALQLTLIDKRIRSVRQLAKRFGGIPVLGHIHDGESGIQQVTAAVVAKSLQRLSKIVSAVPASNALDIGSLIESINEQSVKLGVTVFGVPSMSVINAPDLISSSETAVIIAEEGTTKFDEIANTISILESSNKSVIGIILAEKPR